MRLPHALQTKSDFTMWSARHHYSEETIAKAALQIINVKERVHKALLNATLVVYLLRCHLFAFAVRRTLLIDGLFFSESKTERACYYLIRCRHKVLEPRKV